MIYLVCLTTWRHLTGRVVVLACSPVPLTFGASLACNNDSTSQESGCFGCLKYECESIEDLAMTARRPYNVNKDDTSVY